MVFPPNMKDLVSFANITAVGAAYRDFLISMDGWKMTGHRFRIDSSDFRRKLSQETLKSTFVMISGFLEKSLQHKMVPGDPSCLQIDPRWSLDAPWVLLDPLEIKKKQ